MVKQVKLLVCLLTIVLGLSVTAGYGQPWDGEVSGIWRNGPGNQIVVGNIHISAGDTLIIESGVEVRFTDNFSFTIYGTLLANGTDDEHILFRSNSANAGAWRGIKFSGRNSSGSQMGFCEILYAYRGVEFENSSAALLFHSTIRITESYGVDIDGSNARVEDCTINNTGGTGIVVNGRSLPQVTNCDISNCTGNGISSGSQARPTITGNHITGVNNGLNIQSPGSTIEDNYLMNCRERGMNIQNANGSNVRRNIIDGARGPYVIEVFRSNGVVLIDNTLVNGTGSGVFLFSSNSVILTNNIIASNRRFGITVQASNPILIYNDVWNNSDGNYNGLNVGNDDMSVNPMLDQNYFPTANSEMIDAGDPRSPIDPDGTRNDIGALFYNQNIPPTITDWEPRDLELVDGAQVVQFSVTAVDSNDHPLVYKWYVNGTLRQQLVEPEFSYRFDTEGAYVVRVDVDDRFFMGVSSHTWEFNMDAPLWNEFQPNEFTLSSVYPNPFNSTGRFYLNAIGQTKLRVWDINGRLVMELWDGSLSTGSHGFTIDATNLPTGEYVLSAESEAGLLARKFIVIK